MSTLLLVWSALLEIATILDLQVLQFSQTLDRVILKCLAFTEIHPGMTTEFNCYEAVDPLLFVFPFLGTAAVATEEKEKIFAASILARFLEEAAIFKGYWFISNTDAVF